MRNTLSTQLLFELSKPGRRGACLPTCDVPEQPLADLLPGKSHPLSWALPRDLESESDSLAGEEVTALGSDTLGVLWIGHRNGKISLLHDGRVSRFEPEAGLGRRERRIVDADHLVVPTVHAVEPATRGAFGIDPGTVRGSAVL